MPIATKVAQNFTGEWQVGLFEVPCKSPICFCYGCCCPCCMAIQQRWKILDVVQEEYVCCGGLFPCCCFGNTMPRECAVVEACCCTGLAIAGNRFMVQTRFDRMNTCCDDCILWTACIVSWVVCILRCFLDVPDEIENLVDCMLMTVSGCMLAQQEVEIDYVKTNNLYNGPNLAILGELPPKQFQMVESMGKRPGGVVQTMGAPM